MKKLREAYENDIAAINVSDLQRATVFVFCLSSDLRLTHTDLTGEQQRSDDIQRIIILPHSAHVTSRISNTCCCKLGEWVTVNDR